MAGGKAANKREKKSVLEKMAVAPTKAGMREDLSSRSALMSSTPFEDKAWETSLDGFRVMPRTRHSGRFRKVWATDEPYVDLENLHKLPSVRDRATNLNSGDPDNDNEL